MIIFPCRLHRPYSKFIINGYNVYNSKTGNRMSPWTSKDGTVYVTVHVKSKSKNFELIYLYDKYQKNIFKNWYYCIKHRLQHTK